MLNIAQLSILVIFLETKFMDVLLRATIFKGDTLSEMSFHYFHIPCSPESSHFARL